jgi:predicted ATPase
VARLTQRRDPARLLIVGSYRPTELWAGNHPFRAALRELHLRGLCLELPLPMLDEAAVAEYVAGRFPRGELPAEVATILYGRTEGNPLFMNNVIDTWIGRRLLVEREGSWRLEAPLAELLVGVPDSLRRLVEQKLDRLDAGERRLLEAGSVVGREFATAVVAAATERRAEDVDQTMTSWVREGSSCGHRT